MNRSLPSAATRFRQTIEVENGSGGKSDTLPMQWFAGKDRAYLDMHMIPTDPEIWKLDRYEDFIHGRQKLIRQQFAYLLSTPARTSVE